ncbi:MAG: flagellar basal-body MS-ring/collar protein FliF [Gemmobacter sp.]
MQNVAATWNALDATRRIVVIAATIAMFLAVLGLSRMATAPGMALLYAGLDGAAAGEVVAALESRGVAYEVAGDSIRVDAAHRDQLRMTLASDGLPATGAAGYELLDNLSGFGTTSQMFDAAYWRAKEGEIARTILSVPQIRAARVHIAQAPDQPFRTEARPTASITVTTAGGGLTPAQARALRHLVAAAVPGMTPDDVAVIDSVAGLIPTGDDAAMPGSADTREAELKRNVERLLAARLGPGRAVVEVSLAVVTEREQFTEKTFDPASRVAISSETEESSNTETQPGGDVTVASNLPEGDAGAGASGQSQSSETRERVNYEVSETQREVLRLPGAVRRLTVAVLIDGQTTANADGTSTFTPRSEEEMTALRDLVASAVGLDEARGDVLTLKSMAFEPVMALGTEAAAPGLLPQMGPVNVMSLLQIGILALVVLALGLFVVRPVLLSGVRRTAALPAPDAALSLPGMTTSAPERMRVLDGEIQDDERSPMALLSPGAEDGPEADPVARLRRLIEERQAESVEILRGWMEAEEERA